MTDVQQRHFFHAKLRLGSGYLALPITLLFTKEDAAILSANLERVIDDIFFILGLHAGTILPTREAIIAAGGSVEDVKDSKGGKGIAIYHGHYVSASFEVRSQSVAYAVLEMPLSSAADGDDDGGGGSAVLDLGPGLEDVPIASLWLQANCRHKESEMNRRTAKLLENQPMLQRFLASTASTASNTTAKGAAAVAAAGAGAGAGAGSGRGRGRGRGRGAAASSSAASALLGDGGGEATAASGRGGGGRSRGGGGRGRSKSPGPGIASGAGQNPTV